MGDRVRNPAHRMRRTATHFGSTWGGQDFTNTGVNREDGSLVTGEVEGNHSNDGVLILSACVLGN